MCVFVSMCFCSCVCVCACECLRVCVCVYACVRESVRVCVYDSERERESEASTPLTASRGLTDPSQVDVMGSNLLVWVEG